tara:strand:+ start:8133 stop:8852 length:720 start_codon:yes stop_codon:yes gene_type:complete
MTVHRSGLHYAEFGIDAAYVLPNYDPTLSRSDRENPDGGDCAREGWARTVARLQRTGGSTGAALDASLAACLGDENSARYLLERLRWGDDAICPHCDAKAASRRLNTQSGRPGLWRCNTCKGQFTVTVATALSSTHIPLHLWVYAIHMLCSSRAGLSAGDIAREMKLSHNAGRALLDRLDTVGVLSPVGAPDRADENKQKRRRNRRFTLRPLTTIEVCRRLIRYRPAPATKRRRARAAV